MKLLIINSAETDDRTFVKPIEIAAAQTEADTETVEYCSIPANIDHYDAVIISASPKGDDIVDTHLPLFEWIKTFKGAVLGICAGHQFIGKLFGGKLIKDREMEDGIFTVKIEQNDPIFEGNNSTFETEQHHNDSITLPEGFELLASSNKCQVQAIKQNGKPIYSVQWHAEKSNPDMIINFIRLASRRISNFS